MSAIPRVPGYGAVDGGADGVFVAGDGVNHQAVKQFVCCADGLGGLVDQASARGGKDSPVGSWRGSRAIRGAEDVSFAFLMRCLGTYDDHDSTSS